MESLKHSKQARVYTKMWLMLFTLTMLIFMLTITKAEYERSTIKNKIETMLMVEVEIKRSTVKVEKGKEDQVHEDKEEVER